MQTKWKPPAGWRVLEEGLRKAKPCHICGRNLQRQAIALIQSMMGRFRFRCVDTDDCESVRAMGKEPFFRPKYARFAQELDATRGLA